MEAESDGGDDGPDEKIWKSGDMCNGTDCGNRRRRGNGKGEPWDLEAWDDVSGKALDPEKVKEARKEELGYFRRYEVYKKVPTKECWEKTGKAPIGVRWIDINKGDADNPEYRSRLVAKEIKRDQREDLFAATPPWER